MCTGIFIKALHKTAQISKTIESVNHYYIITQLDMSMRMNNYSFITCKNIKQTKISLVGKVKQKNRYCVSPCTKYNRWSNAGYRNNGEGAVGTIDKGGLGSVSVQLLYGYWLWLCSMSESSLNLQLFSCSLSLCQ